MAMQGVGAKPRPKPGKEEGAMREETRRRRRANDFLKVLLKFAFSQAGDDLFSYLFIPFLLLSSSSPLTTIPTFILSLASS